LSPVSCLPRNPRLTIARWIPWSRHVSHAYPSSYSFIFHVQFCPNLPIGACRLIVPQTLACGTRHQPLALDQPFTCSSHLDVGLSISLFLSYFLLCLFLDALMGPTLR
jgi:hypothetical protein